MESILKLFNKNFINLFFAQLFTHLGDALIQVVFIAYIIANIEKPGYMISFALLCFILPSFIISPLAGSIVDRFSRKKIMFCSAIYRASIILGLLILYFLFNKYYISGKPIWLELTTINFLIGIGTAFFYPAKMAIIPHVVPAKSLKPANALISSSGTWALTFGALVSTYIFTGIGSLKTIYIAFGLYFIASILLLTLKNIKKDFCTTNSVMNEQFSVIKDYRKTSSFLKSHKRALNMIGLAVVMALISAGIYNSMNAVATNDYHLGIQRLAQLKCMLGCGTCYGVAVIFLFGKYLKTNKLLAMGFMGLFLCLITSPLCNTFMKARIWLICIGILASILNITIITILQKISPDFIRGKVFAFLSMLTTIASIIATGMVTIAVKFIEPLFIIQIIALFSALLSFIILIAGREFIYKILKATLCRIIRL